MLDVLIASQPLRRRPLAQALASAALHATLAFAAVKGTQGVAEALRQPVPDATLFFALKPEVEEPPEVKTPDPPPPAEVIVSVDPPPKGFQTVVPPSEVPTVIPPIDLKEHALDPRNFSGRGVEGGVAGGVVGGTGPVDAAAKVKGAVFVAAELDEPAQVVFQPAPRYPPVLQSAGIGGAVALEFVVGVEGTVEPPTVHVVETTDTAFVESAREAILHSSFRPARMRGQPVRQLARQTIRFAITVQ